MSGSEADQGWRSQQGMLWRRRNAAIVGAIHTPVAHRTLNWLEAMAQTFKHQASGQHVGTMCVEYYKPLSGSPWHWHWPSLRKGALA